MVAAFKVLKCLKGEKAGRIIAETTELVSAENTVKKHMKLNPAYDYRIVPFEMAEVKKHSLDNKVSRFKQGSWREKRI